MHFAEHAKGAIYNLTFANQQEGLQQFEAVCKTLDVLQAGKGDTLRPLATADAVRTQDVHGQELLSLLTSHAAPLAWWTLMGCPSVRACWRVQAMHHFR